MPKTTIVDSNFLIDLGEGDRVAEEVLYHLRVKGYRVSLSATGGHELVDMSEQEGGSHQEQAMSSLLRTLGTFGISFPPLEATAENPTEVRLQNDYAIESAEHLIRAGLFDDVDKNLALIVCEAAAMGAEIVIFDEFFLSRFDRDAVRAELDSRGLTSNPLIKGRLEVLQM